jgi:hypothetical protein
VSRPRSGVLFFAPSTISDGRNLNRRKTQQAGGAPPPLPRYSARTEIVRPLRDGLNCTVPAWVA